MVLGNLIQISANGAEDKYLYGNPQVTYFKDVYKRSTNFAINYNKVPFSGGSTVEFGSEIKVNIPIKGDLLSGVFLRLDFSDLQRTNDYKEYDINGDTINSTRSPQFTSYVNGIGYNCIDTIKLYINGQLIETVDSKLIYLSNELYNNQGKKTSFYRMSKYTQNNFNIGGSLGNNISDVKSTLLIPLFFSGKPSMYLPLCALTHSEIQLHIKFKTIEKCVVRSYQTSSVPDSWSDLPNAVPGTGDTNSKEDSYAQWENFISDIGSIKGLNTDDTRVISALGPSSATDTGFENKNQLVPSIVGLTNGVYKVPATFELYNESVTGNIENFEIITENIFLDSNERVLFMNKELSYLIELYHIGNTEIIENPSSSKTYYMDIEGKHPTKYILWYLQREDVNDNNIYDNHTSENGLRFEGSYNYDNSKHLLKDAIIMINNNELVNNINSIFLSDVQMYQKFHNSSNSLMYVYSFALDPTKTEPTGTLNFSKIMHKSIKLQLEDEAKYTNNTFSHVNYFLDQNTDAQNQPISTTQNLLFKYYTCYYNILLIRDGLCSLIYK